MQYISFNSLAILALLSGFVLYTNGEDGCPNGASFKIGSCQTCPCKNGLLSACAPATCNGSSDVTSCPKNTAYSIDDCNKCDCTSTGSPGACTLAFCETTKCTRATFKKEVGNMCYSCACTFNKKPICVRISQKPCE